jgi:uncharacterized protein (DUF302 family)
MRINFKKELSGTMETVIEKVTKALLEEGFGVLTRIDLHTKIKEKLNKTILPTVILGSCNPSLAFDAYTLNSDVASLLPCNAVLREIQPGKISIELAKPSILLDILGDENLINLSEKADRQLEQVLNRIE